MEIRKINDQLKRVDFSTLFSPKKKINFFLNKIQSQTLPKHEQKQTTNKRKQNEKDSNDNRCTNSVGK